MELCAPRSRTSPWVIQGIPIPWDKEGLSGTTTGVPVGCSALSVHQTLPSLLLGTRNGSPPFIPSLPQPSPVGCGGSLSLCVSSLKANTIVAEAVPAGSGAKRGRSRGCCRRGLSHGPEERCEGEPGLT